MNILSIIIALTVATTVIDESTTFYNEGNRLVRESSYSLALESYNKLTVANPELEYNRGFAYFQLGNLGKAMLHFNRALLYEPAHKNALIAIKELNKIKFNKVDMEDELMIQSGILYKISYNQILSIGVIIVFLLAISTIFMIFKTKSEAAEQVTLLLLVLFFLTSSFGLLKFYFSYHDNRGVVTSKEAKVYRNSSINSDHILTAHEATILKILSYEGSFAKIELSNQLVGWVEKNKIERIKI